MATDCMHLRRSRRRLCGEPFKVPFVLMHDIARLGAPVIVEHGEVRPFHNLTLPVGQG